MLVLRHGDIFKSGCQALVNPVNCKGVMGAGLAKQFQHLYPEIYPAYYEACRSGKLVPGVILPTKTRTQIPEWILNFPTKDHWKGPSRLEWIEQGLIELVKVVNSLSIDLVAVPALGCGLGGLEWPKIYKLMYDHLSSPDVKYFVYPPS